MSQSFDLEGKTALITGASRGIGFAIADKFLKNGSKIVISSRKVPDLENAAKKLSKNGKTVYPISVNTGDSDSITNLISESIKVLGGIDITINNAATSPHYGSVFTSQESHWDKIWDVNVKGYYKIIAGSVNTMIERGGGKIINIASIAGKQPFPGMGIYCVSKAAVIMLTKVLAQELASKNIQVNAIAPGFVKTKFSSVLWENDIIYKKNIKNIPAGRMAKPDEIAGLALFLASDASSFTTGETITVDGGQSI